MLTFKNVDKDSYELYREGELVGELFFNYIEKRWLTIGHFWMGLEEHEQLVEQLKALQDISY